MALAHPTRRLEIWDNATHWITILHFSGHSLPADNGYLIRCLPKHRLPRAEFAKQVESEIKEMFPDGPAGRVDSFPKAENN
jgi:hypothetical protein